MCDLASQTSDNNGYAVHTQVFPPSLPLALQRRRKNFAHPLISTKFRISKTVFEKHSSSDNFMGLNAIYCILSFRTTERNPFDVNVPAMPSYNNQASHLQTISKRYLLPLRYTRYDSMPFGYKNFTHRIVHLTNFSNKGWFNR